jgi:hypothetical protein
VPIDPRPQSKTAIALLSLTSALAKGLSLPARLYDKLNVPCVNFLPALASLSAGEVFDLKGAVVGSAARKNPPGPGAPDEICDFLDRIIPSQERIGGQSVVEGRRPGIQPSCVEGSRARKSRVILPRDFA